MLLQQFSRLFALAVTMSIVSMASAQNAKLLGLLERSPSPANSLAYVHVPSLTKLAHEAKFTTELSDQLEEVWLISKMNTSSLSPQWEAGFASMKSTASPQALADRLGGYVDKIGTHQVIWSPKQSYLLPSDESHLGFLRPADRSLLSDWLHTSTKHHVDGYLVKQSKRPESYLSLLVAIDLKDAISPVPLSMALTEFDSLKGKDTKAVANVLATIEGVSLIVGRKSLAQSIFAVQFGTSPKALQPFAGELLHEITVRNGTCLPELLEWEAKVDGNTLSMHGHIAEDTLDTVLKIFTLNGHAGAVADSASEVKSKIEFDKGPSGYTTKKYFDKVKVQIESVRRYHAQTTGARAQWNDIRARHIDEFDIFGVDDEIVDYGAAVASALRNDASAITNININAGKTQAAEGTRTGGNGGGYGSGGYGRSGYYGGRNGGYGYNGSHRSAATDAQRVTRAYARGNAYQNYKQMLSAIDQLTANMRREMEKKYNIPF